MNENYQICSRCVMDTTDPNISFDESGICNHCKEADEIGKKVWFPNEEGQRRLNNIIKEMKDHGKGKRYDAIAGLSGGIDSSYLLYKASKEWNLRILAIHVDGGWNNDIAAANVKVIGNLDNVDLKIIKINWEDMRNMQLAFLKASVPNQDIPQDHAFFSTLYKYAVDNNIQYVLNGSNWETENILPKSWGYNASDGKHITDIYNKFGEKKISQFPITNVYKLKIYYPYIKKMKIVKPLNLMPYNKDLAIKELECNTDWRYYGGKHYESIWTKFFQAYYLPVKFNIDKRRAHLSSLIMSGQLTREDALNELEQLPYDEQTIEAEKELIANKLGIKINDLNDLINRNNRKHDDFANAEDSFLYKILFAIHKKIKG